jgi:hypothetical protein
MKSVHIARKQVSFGSSLQMLALKYPDISFHHQLWIWVPLVSKGDIARIFA